MCETPWLPKAGGLLDDFQALARPSVVGEDAAVVLGTPTPKNWGLHQGAIVPVAFRICGILDKDRPEILYAVVIENIDCRQRIDNLREK